MTPEQEKEEMDRAQERMNEFIRQQQAQQAHAQAEHFRIVTGMQQRAAEVQADINNRPLRQYAAIVAVDKYGGFSKDGQIPWHYPADFKWFKEKTTGHVCVMGRTTYDDINTRLGEKAAESVLPNRMCFVVTSRPLERDNATAVKCIGDVDVLLDQRDVPFDKTVFFIGGEMIYREGIAKCNTVYMTVVNKNAECDKFFPKNSILNYFDVEQCDTSIEPTLAFMTWKRRA